MMQYLSRLIIAITFILSPSVAFSAACVGTAFAKAAGNWSGATTWVTTSGGSTNCTLTAGNAVVFDTGSGSGTYTIDASISITTFDASASTAAITLTQGGVTLTVTGNTFKFNTIANGFTFNGVNSARIILFTPASANTVLVTSAGQNFGAVTLNGADGTAGLQIQDDLNVNAGGAGFYGPLTITQGVFDANNHNVTIGNFLSTNSNTRTVTMGSGTWTLTGDSGTGNTWDTTTTTGLTFNKNTANIVVSANTANLRTFNTGGLTFNGISIGANSNYSPLAFSGNATWSSFAVTAPNLIQFAAGSTTAISSAFTLAGNSTSIIYLRCAGATNGTTATISATTGSTLQWSALSYITFSTSSVSATNSFDLLSNNMNGGSISPPSGGSGGHIIGG